MRFFVAVSAALFFCVAWADSARVTLALPSHYTDGTPIVEGDIRAVRVAYGAPGQPPFIRLLDPAQTDFELSGIPSGSVEFSAAVLTGDFDWSDYSAPQTVFFTAQAGLKAVLGFDLVRGGERMAITFVGARVSNSDPANSVTVDAHPDIQAGDFVVIDCYHDANVITGAFLDNAAGVALLFSHYGQTGTEREVATFYGFVGETPPASWTLNWDSTNGAAATSAVASVYRGVDTGNPFDVAFVLGSHVVDDANMHNPTSPAITTVTNGAVVHVAAAISQDDLTAAGAPANYTLAGSMLYAASPAGTQPNLFDPGADDANLEVAYRTIATAGTETPGAWQNTDNGTAAVSDTTAWTLALRPAAAGGGVTLTVPDMATAAALDEAVLTQANSLSVDDAAVAATLDNVALTQAYVLVVPDMASAVALDGVELSTAVLLNVPDLLAASSFENVALTQANILSADSLGIAIALESPTLSASSTLSVGDIAVAAGVDSPVLTHNQLLAVQDMLVGLAMDSPALLTGSVLVVPDMSVLAGMELVNLGGGVFLADNIIVVSGFDRIVKVESYDRIVKVDG